MNEENNSSVTRRGVVKGIGGLAALSMSNATVAEAQEVLAAPLSTDPHTRDTYRAIVDAIVPRTPELEDELGPEHVPGGLAVELEKFIVWDFNHFQEIRSEAVADDTDVLAGEAMPRSQFEVTLDTTEFATDLDAVVDLAGLGALDDLDEEALAERLTFGAVDRYESGFADLDTDAEGPAEFEVTVETSDERYHRVLQNYPYAATFPFVFDLVAAEFLVSGQNHDQPAASDQFSGGGTFVRLSREDRLRCLWTIADGGAVDRLDDLLSPLMPNVGILKFVVMAVNGLHGFGYYTEWAGYGDTKTATPSDRELQTPAGEVQSRRQSGYPGPADGYAANWRHAIPGGFRDQWKTDQSDGRPDTAGDVTGGEQR